VNSTQCQERTVALHGEQYLSQSVADVMGDGQMVVCLLLPRTYHTRFSDEREPA
jgi:hypothetical protein